MPEHASTAIVLNLGDRLEARPCVVTIDYLGWANAHGQCETCEDGHLIDRAMFEAGAGPWRRVEYGSDRDAE